MGRTIEEVILSLSAETKGINDLIGGLDKTKASLMATAKQTWIAERNMSSFGEVLKMDRKEFRQFHELGGKMKTFGGRVAFGLRKATAGLGGFRMEMLSVMFFGLGIKNFFMGLIQPALQMAGVFDILRTALGILFLPLALVVLDWALKFLDWVTNMPPWLQKLINWIAGLGVIFGTILFVVGSVTLGIGGLITAFAGFGAIIAFLLASPLVLLIAALLGVGGLAAAIAIIRTGFELAGSIANRVFQGILNLFPNLRDALEDAGYHTQSLGMFLDDVWKKAKEAFWKWAQQHPWFVIDFLRFKNSLVDAWDDFKIEFSGIIDIIKQVWGWLDWLSDKITSVFSAINNPQYAEGTYAYRRSRGYTGIAAMTPPVNVSTNLIITDGTRGGINASSSDTIFEAERGVVR